MASFLSSIHVDQPLSNLAIQYQNAELIADRVFPQLPVNKMSGKYFIYTKSDTPVINFVVSNVGGIEGPRYLGRSRLVGAYPLSMLADPVGLNFTSVSSDGRMDTGVIASRAAVPDTDPIIRHCPAAWRQLVRARAPQDLTLRKPPARKRSRTRLIPATQRS